MDYTTYSELEERTCNFNTCQNIATYYGVCEEHEALED